MSIETEKALAAFEHRLMSVPDFAEQVLGCSRSMGWRLAKEGAFPVIRNGRLVRVEPRKALDAYIAKFSRLPRK
jgi:hypothetical protein